MKKRYHIILDGSHCPKDLLSNKKLVKAVIRGLADICDMQIVYGPALVEGIPQNPGITCFAIVDFSHISIHTFTDSNEVCVDVFSCKGFDYEKAKRFVQYAFEIKDKHLKYLEVNYD